jgi:two-component system, NarL family, response regulator LiaR
MSTSLDTRISLVEDSREYTLSFTALCRASEHLHLVSSHSTVKDALSGLCEHRADVVVLDLGLPDGDGIDVLRQLKGKMPDAQWLVLTVYEDDLHLFQALEAGAVGYILKDQALQEGLVAAIDEALAGGAPMSLSIARRVIERFRQPKQKNAHLPELTRRENEVLQQLARGYSAKKVADILGISHGTVRCHQKSIYRKLHVNSVVAAVSELKQV